MGLVISRANSMHFVKVDSNLPNVENTPSYEEYYASWKRREYCQKWQHDDVVTVQMVSDSAVVPTVEVIGRSPTVTPTAVTAPLKTFYVATGDLDARYYFEMVVTFANYPNNIIQIKVTQGAVVWLSEMQYNGDLDDDLDDGYLLKFEYTNRDQPSALPNFQIDYTTDIYFFFYVEASVRENGVIGEDEYYVNVEDRELIEAQLFKQRTLKTMVIPEFMTDKITLGGKHYVFVINDLRYTTEGMPSITTGGSNLKVLEWSIVHAETLGLSTDDKGLKGALGDPVMSERKEDVTPGNEWTVTVPSGYLVHEIICGHASGSSGDYTIKAGLSTGADDLVADGLNTIALAATRTTPIILHEYPVFDSATTVYINVTGAGAIADLIVHLLLI